MNFFIRSAPTSLGRELAAAVLTKPRALLEFDGTGDELLTIRRLTQRTRQTNWSVLWPRLTHIAAGPSRCVAFASHERRMEWFSSHFAARKRRWVAPRRHRSPGATAMAQSRPRRASQRPLSANVGTPPSRQRYPSIRNCVVTFAGCLRQRRWLEILAVTTNGLRCPRSVQTRASKHAACSSLVSQAALSHCSIFQRLAFSSI